MFLHVKTYMKHDSYVVLEQHENSTFMGFFRAYTFMKSSLWTRIKAQKYQVDNAILTLLL